ncbi:hypothetical protein L9F63_010166, partial [Diploptera punctata]
LTINNKWQHVMRRARKGQLIPRRNPRSNRVVKLVIVPLTAQNDGSLKYIKVRKLREFLSKYKLWADFTGCSNRPYAYRLRLKQSDIFGTKLCILFFLHQNSHLAHSDDLINRRKIGLYRIPNKNVWSLEKFSNFRSQAPKSLNETNRYPTFQCAKFKTRTEENQEKAVVKMADTKLDLDRVCQEQNPEFTMASQNVIKLYHKFCLGLYSCRILQISHVQVWPMSDC